ncbi:MAG: multidrug transporter [Anaerolineae bacterium]|nr:MAG: multidrug transporter [Anaerolineae bacterium]
MIKVAIKDPRYIYPFNDHARDLRIQNKLLWLHQRDVLAPYAQTELEANSLEEVLNSDFFKFQNERACIVYADNLYFDEFFVNAFMTEARKRGKACRAAFSPADPSFREHALPLATSYTPAGGLYLADFWYFPDGPVPEAQVEPVLIDLQAREVGYYHVPTYMASQSGDLTFQVPLRALIAIDSWVHIFIVDIVFGLFARGARFEDRLNQDLVFKLKILAGALYEGKQILESRELVKVGRNASIDPTAIIHGPTTIGDNVTIGAGAVIENCIIGDNVNVSQGCQLMLSVVGDGTFLPFRASLFMTTLMDNSMVAQNTCLQMCVVGRNTFIGAGSTWTDYNLLPAPIRALDGAGKLSDANRAVLGGCVGHNCRIGAGVVVSPARVIESDVVIVSGDKRRVIDHNVPFEQSDHHQLKAAQLHKRLYDPEREKKVTTETW